MEATAVRRVRQVRLRAEDAAAAQRGLLLLEDALHTAALPDARGQLLVVRRLDVGPIDPHGGPNRVALAVEARLRAIALHAVAADEPGDGQAARAASAGAVTFRDTVAPYVALALRLAHGEAADAWYWPLAIAGWRAEFARAGGLRWVALRAAAVLPRAAGAQRVAAALARAGLTRALLAALEAGDGARLLQAHGIAPGLFAAPSAPDGAPAFGQARPASPPPTTPVPLPAHWRTALAQAAVQVGTQDARLWWLALAAVGEAAPALLLAPAAAVQAARAAVAALTTAPPNTVHRAPPARHRRDSTNTASLSPNDRSPQPPPVEAAVQTPAQAPGPEEEEGRLTGAPTAGGGLLFVIPLLHALGFAAWLAERPALAAARLPERLLLLLAGRTGLPPEDPLAGWLAGTVQDAPAAAGVEDACRMWRAGLRGWLARRARLSLGALILRPALLAVTPTHVDVTFALALADLRIRRLGLDADPGWVAWLGRVVSFHYTDKVTG